MKIQILFCFLMLSALPEACGDRPHTFEEFKKLSRAERDALLEDNADPLIYWIVQWTQRLSMGEDSWHQKEFDEIIGLHGLNAVSAVFIDYQHFQESYLERQLMERQHDVTDQVAKSKASDHYRREMKVAADNNHDIVPLIAAVAPSSESKALNRQASELLDQWEAKWPGGARKIITPADMAVINRSIGDISNRLRTIKKLTAEELQKEITALPINSSSGAATVHEN